MARIDSFSTDCYKRFWNILGPDLRRLCFFLSPVSEQCLEIDRTKFFFIHDLIELNLTGVGLLYGEMEMVAIELASNLWSETHFSDTTKRPERGCSESHRGVGLVW